MQRHRKQAIAAAHRVIGSSCSVELLSVAFVASRFCSRISSHTSATVSGSSPSRSTNSSPSVFSRRSGLRFLFPPSSPSVPSGWSSASITASKAACTSRKEAGEAASPSSSRKPVCSSRTTALLTAPNKCPSTGRGMRAGLVMRNRSPVGCCSVGSACRRGPVCLSGGASADDVRVRLLGEAVIGELHLLACRARLQAQHKVGVVQSHPRLRRRRAKPSPR
mmetsp:Transcript_16574/g.55752  ORF Transcript_16574/g.55752 Transcript_16574/m.55752 type:complete len:221 (-) Transcript_16574:113-775(-)